MRINYNTIKQSVLKYKNENDKAANTIDREKKYLMNVINLENFLVSNL